MLPKGESPSPQGSLAQEQETGWSLFTLTQEAGVVLGGGGEKQEVGQGCKPSKSAFSLPP